MFSREGGSPSPAGLVEQIPGDGPLGFGKLPRSFRRLRPSPGHCDFSTAIQKLSGVASGILGWTPDQFWRATPAELAVIFVSFATTGADRQAAVPLDAQQLENLKETFPDG